MAYIPWMAVTKMNSNAISDGLKRLFSGRDVELPRYWRIDREEYSVYELTGFRIEDYWRLLNVARDVARDTEVRAVMYIDLGCSDHIVLSVPSDLSEAVGQAQALYFYAMNPRDTLFELEGECFFCELNIDSELVGNCLLRCFRDKESAKNDWEWNIGVYLY